MSIRSKGDFNLRADKNVNIEAGNNVNIKAVGDNDSSGHKGVASAVGALGLPPLGSGRQSKFTFCRRYKYSC